MNLLVVAPATVVAVIVLMIEKDAVEIVVPPKGHKPHNWGHEVNSDGAAQLKIPSAHSN